MREQDLRELLELERKLFEKLTELAGLTQELCEAAARQDPVSLELLLTARQKALLEAQEIRSHEELKRVELSSPDRTRMDALLGGAQAETAQEQPVANQVATNRRLLERVSALDRQANLALCAEQSIYKTKTGSEGIAL